MQSSQPAYDRYPEQCMSAVLVKCEALVNLKAEKPVSATAHTFSNQRGKVTALLIGVSVCVSVRSFGSVRSPSQSNCRTCRWVSVNWICSASGRIRAPHILLIWVRYADGKNGRSAQRQNEWRHSVRNRRCTVTYTCRILTWMSRAEERQRKCEPQNWNTTSTRHPHSNTAHTNDGFLLLGYMCVYTSRQIESLFYGIDLDEIRLQCVSAVWIWMWCMDRTLYFGMECLPCLCYWSFSISINPINFVFIFKYAHNRIVHFQAYLNTIW